jgi:PTS system nitrogen regulatory IIA component
MKITKMLNPEYIIPELKSVTKEEALAELSANFPYASLNCDQATAVNALINREKLGSTGIGDGIAIPHGKMCGLDDLLLSFGRSKKGVAFDAMDGKPAHLFFLLIVPEDFPSQHLKLLAKISRMLKDTAFRKKLMEASSRDDLYRLIVEKDDLV